VTLQASGALISVLPNNPFFVGQTQVNFSYPTGTSINNVIENTNLGDFIKEPRQQDVRLVTETLNDTPTLGG
jgi:hypothetical protein